VTLDALKAHRTYQSEARLKAGVRWKEQGLVFPHRDGGYFRRPRLYAIFKKIVQEASLPDMHFHDVRRFGDCKIALKGQKVRAFTF
jgi:integrase